MNPNPFSLEANFTTSSSSPAFYKWLGGGGWGAHGKVTQLSNKLGVEPDASLPLSCQLSPPQKFPSRSPRLNLQEHLQRRAQGPPDSCGARTFGAVVRKSAWPTAAASRHCHLMDTQRNRKRSPLLRTKGSPLLLCSPTSLEHGKGKAVSHSDRRRVLQIRCCEHTNK